MDERVTPGVPERAPRLRFRVPAVVLAVAVIVASGVFLQRDVGARSLSPAGSDGRSGGWFCPHGGSPGWQGWMVLTNPGPDSVQVRMTTFDSSGVGGVDTFTVPALRQAYRAIPVEDLAASTEVEYFGGWVGAEAVVESSRANGAMAAERCVTAPHTTWYVPDVTTRSDETAYLVVMNPFTQRAAFDVSMRTEQRLITPSVLSPLVLPPRTATTIRVNDYALQSPDEDTVSAHVIQRIGRVVVGSLVMSGATIRSETGVPGSADRWVLPGAGYLAPSALILDNPGDRRADLSISFLPGSGQSGAGLGAVSMPPGTVRTLDVLAAAGTGVMVVADDGVSVVAALRGTGPNGDGATLSGSMHPYPRWLVMPSLPAFGGTSSIVVANPGLAAARVSFELIGASGPLPAQGLRSLTIQPGRVSVLRVSSFTRNVPTSVLVAATAGTVVVSCLSYSLVGDGYAATLGLPITNAG